MADRDEKNTEPSNIIEAVTSVMLSIGTLGKENKNKFDSYDYASIDDFILFVRRPIAGAGLVVIQDELEARLVDVTKKDGKPMAMWWARYAFTLRWGDEALGPVHKTVMVQANGAQASGSAQSYALKQFFRTQFLIPTGDGDDPDTKTTEISSNGTQLTDLQKKANKIRDALSKSETVDDLEIAWSDNSVTIDEIKRASETGHEYLKNYFNERKIELEAKA